MEKILRQLLAGRHDRFESFQLHVVRFMRKLTIINGIFHLLKGYVFEKLDLETKKTEGTEEGIPIFVRATPHRNVKVGKKRFMVKDEGFPSLRMVHLVLAGVLRYSYWDDTLRIPHCDRTMGGGCGNRRDEYQYITLACRKKILHLALIFPDTYKTAHETK